MGEVTHAWNVQIPRMKQRSAVHKEMHYSITEGICYLHIDDNTPQVALSYPCKPDVPVSQLWSDVMRKVLGIN